MPSQATGSDAQRRPAATPFGADLAGVQTMLAAIVMSSDDAIVSKDLHGTIMSWNAGAERLFGYTAEEAVGRPVTMLLPPERQAEETEILATLIRGDRIHHFETERIRKDGRRIHVSISVSPIRDAEGRTVGGAKIARDVSLRKRLDAEREVVLAKEREARNLAEQASRSKDAFLAMISHELRTPLTPILAWARLLKQGRLGPEKTDRAINAIDRNATLQAQLIDDLLDVSRIVAGKMRLNVGPVDLVAVIEAALEVVRPAADAKGIRIDASLARDVGAVSGDPGRLQQVVWNLLSNAVKFTPERGEVRVRLAPVPSGVQIVVSDTGPGIAPEFLPYLFEQFQQAEAGSTRVHGGLGLGLAIVRHIVELHGGTVRAESGGAGRGATFTVQLLRLAPVAPLEPLDPTRSAFVGEAGDTTLRIDGLRVLVVDDQPESSEVVTAVLSAYGADVRAAGSSAEGLAVLRQWVPDVIVSDIAMPDEDGYAFVAKVRAQRMFAHLPVIALTAYANTEDRVRILSAGFQMHVPKPIDPAELIAVVASATRPRSSDGNGR